jgi:hypothetical protein
MKMQEGTRGARNRLPEEVNTRAEARKVLVDMTAQARRM